MQSNATPDEGDHTDRSAPTVSVCIPSYQGRPYLALALRSVLAQTLGDLEVVVSDDGSTDGTLESLGNISDERVRVLADRSRRGAESNWNAVLAAARGRYVKVMGQDDILYPRCLEVQVAAIDRQPGAVMAAGPRDIIDGTGRTLIRKRGLSGLKGTVKGPVALRAIVRSGTNLVGEPASVLLRRELAERIGPFDGSRPYAIDVDYWCRALLHGDLVVLQQTLSAFRVSATSWSAALAKEQSVQMRSLFRELAGRHPDILSRRDLRRAQIMAELHGLGRRAVLRVASRATPRASAD